MFPELSEIKAMRKQLSLTQHELAKHARVSQSLIAKLEAGTIDPTYSNVRRIFETLSLLGKADSVKASVIMKSGVVYATPSEKITSVIADMKKNSISQLPVVDKGVVVGMISETILLSALLEGGKKVVSEVMADAPPTVSKDTDIKVVSSLLMHFPMVAVMEKGALCGVITKSDVIEKLKK